MILKNKVIEDLMRARHRFKCFTNTDSELGFFIISISQIRKLRHKEHENFLEVTEE